MGEAGGLTAASRELAFFWQQKKACKENCRCFDAADPRLRGCTPLRTPKRRSEVSAAKRTQYYCPFLTPPSLPPLLSRVFPRTPAVYNGCFPSRAQPAKGSPSGELAALAGLRGPDGPCLVVRYLRKRPGIPPPRYRSAPPFDKGGFSRGRASPAQKGSPLCGELAEPARPEGLCRALRCRSSPPHHRSPTQSTP